MKQQIQARRDECARFERYFSEVLEYDRVSRAELQIEKHQLCLAMQAFDYFQEKAGYEAHFQHGTQYFYADYGEANPMEEIWRQVRALRRREYRELRVLCAQAGAAAEMHDALASAAGREFAARMVEARAEYAGLLEHLE